MINIIHDVTCHYCGVLIWNTPSGGFEIHEVNEGWAIVCVPCDLDVIGDCE